MSTDVPGGPDPHRRAKRALVGLYGGLLDDAGDAWLTGHLAACDACRVMAEQMATESAARIDDGRHLPASLMGRWRTEYPRLQGPVRAFVNAHIESCAECRRGLEILGHAVEVPAIAPRPVVRARSAFWGLLSTAKGRWVSAGGLVGATAMLVLMLNIVTRTGPEHVMGVARNEPVPGHASPTGRPATDIGPAGADPIAPRLTPDPAALVAWSDAEFPGSRAYAEISLDRTVTRGVGGADSVNVYRVKAGIRTLKILHPEAAFLVEGDSVRVRITLRTPSGMTLRRTLRVRELKRDRPLRLHLPDGVETGVYQFAYEFDPARHEPPIRGEVRVEVR